MMLAPGSLIAPPSQTLTLGRFCFCRQYAQMWRFDSTNILAYSKKPSRSRRGISAHETERGTVMTRPQHGSNRPWSVPLTLRDVPESGRHFDLFADKQTRAAVAEHAGLAALPRLEASFDVTPHRRGGGHGGGRGPAPPRPP